MTQSIIFLNWAKENDIEFSAALAEKVLQHSGNLIDWRGEYERLKTLYDDLASDWKRIVEKQNESLETYRQRIELLEAQLARCQGELHSKPESAAPEKAQSSRERDNMLKVIYAMAVGGYGFDAAILQLCGGKHHRTMNWPVTSATGLRAYRRAIVACFVFRQEISREAVWD